MILQILLSPWMLALAALAIGLAFGFAAIITDDIDDPDGSDNMGGIKTTIYYTDAANITTWPVPSENPSAPEDSVNLSGNFELATGKKWHSVYVTQDTGGVEDMIQGDRDGKSFINKLTFFTPGNKPKLLGLIKQLLNANTVWLVPDAQGQYRVVGSEDFPAKMDEATITTGQTTEDRRGATMTFSNASRHPAGIYTGSVDEYSGSGS
jgi:hypothetical protein